MHAGLHIGMRARLHLTAPEQSNKVSLNVMVLFRVSLEFLRY